MITSFMTFLGISAIIITAPGPDTAVVVRNTLLGGRLTGITTALGSAAGQTIWVLATSFGLVALLVASEPLFLAIKYVGAAYLVYLGVQALIGAVLRRPAVRRWMGGITGTVLIALGVRLAAEKA